MPPSSPLNAPGIYNPTPHWTYPYGVPGRSTESYDQFPENPFQLTHQEPLSTFSIDVDTASYSNVRRFLAEGRLPVVDAVRIEELMNYFSYDYPPPTDGNPFAAHVEMAVCPWNTDHYLVKVGLKGQEMPEEERPPCNLVFLLDVSGSMNDSNKLPLLKPALRMLVNRLTERDRVAIVVYAGAAGLVLPSTPCERKGEILAAIDRLEAGGSTNGGEGIQLAYRTLQESAHPGAVHRVVLCTDGDFNVGVTDREQLLQMIETNARRGIYLSVLGFGMGDYQDGTLEHLADRGNGNYAYIDTIHEARKVLVDQIGGTLVTIAEDVKIQVEFNPAHVAAYRLIGYENRALEAEDFNDDTKDAGEIGAGHTVTALYELVPPGKEGGLPTVDPLRYQPTPQPSARMAHPDELLTIKLRYKDPESTKSRLLTFSVDSPSETPRSMSEDFRFAAAVACFGMLLRNSPHKGHATYDMALDLAQTGKGADPGGYRAELVQLLRTAKALGGSADDGIMIGTRPAPYSRPYR